MIKRRQTRHIESLVSTKLGRKQTMSDDTIARGRLLQYGFVVTHAQLNEMYATQNGKCKICDKPFEINKLSVDHSHKNNKVRGLLCTKCNVLIGMAEDNIDVLYHAIEYLKMNSGV